MNNKATSLSKSIDDPGMLVWFDIKMANLDAKPNRIYMQHLKNQQKYAKIGIKHKEK
jgi:hypothetical protein